MISIISVITRLLELGYVWDDWAIPWAGIGAFLMGTGSVLTGIAALKNAQKRGKKDEAEEANTTSATDGKSRTGTRSRVSDSDST